MRKRRTCNLYKAREISLVADSPPVRPSTSSSSSPPTKQQLISSEMHHADLHAMAALKRLTTQQHMYIIQYWSWLSQIYNIIPHLNGHTVLQCIVFNFYLYCVFSFNRVREFEDSVSKGRVWWVHCSHRVICSFSLLCQIICSWYCLVWTLLQVMWPLP